MIHTPSRAAVMICIHGHRGIYSHLHTHFLRGEGASVKKTAYILTPRWGTAGMVNIHIIIWDFPVI